jgi:hypothetical protein
MDPDKSVLLHYLPEDVIELHNIFDDHWASRVLQEKTQRIIINDEELMGFLSIANNATFGFFKIPLKASANIYLLIVTPHV